MKKLTIIAITLFLTACGGGSGDSSPVQDDDAPEVTQPNPFEPVVNQPVIEPVTPVVVEPVVVIPVVEPIIEPVIEPPVVVPPVEGEDPVYSPDPIATVNAPVENPDDSVFEAISSRTETGNGGQYITLNSVTTYNNKRSDMGISIANNTDDVWTGVFCSGSAFDEWGNFINFTGSQLSDDSWHALNIQLGESVDIDISFSNDIPHGIDFYAVNVSCSARFNPSHSGVIWFSKLFLIQSD